MVASSLVALVNIVDDVDADDEIDDVAVVAHNYLMDAAMAGVDIHRRQQHHYLDDVNFPDVEASFVHHHKVHSHHNVLVFAVVVVDD